MAFLIDTAVVPATERLEYWADASGRVYHPVSMRAAPSVPFSGRMTGHDLGAVMGYRIVASEATMRQTARTIRSFDPEALMFEVVLEGESWISQGERCAVLRTGDVAAYTTSQPVTVRAHKPFETLVFRIPRFMLGAHAERIDRLTALRVPADFGLVRLVRTYCRHLMDGLDAGEIPQSQSHLGESVLDLVLSLYVGPGGADHAVERGSKEGLVVEVKRFIDENLGDPALSPELIARTHFISTRHLHRLFEAEGVSVCAWIRDRRLDRCRRDLADPMLRSVAIADIAARRGLIGAAHFSRMFRSAFGCSPREYRTSMAARVGAHDRQTDDRPGERASGAAAVRRIVSFDVNSPAELALSDKLTSDEPE